MKITVIGAGSWGTALALHFAHHNNEVALWTRNPDQIRTLQADRENKRGLPGFPFPESLTVHADLGEALKDSNSPDRYLRSRPQKQRRAAQTA